jgi:UDP-glucose:glycoprotein glucosyltransferase
MRSHYIILLLLLRSIPHSFAKSSFSWSENENDVSSLVSPIVNRELEASVVAHAWPFTLGNIVCEAWAYHHSDWEFMDALVARLQDQQEAITEISDATQLVKDATLKPTDKSLLEYALSLRAYSPQCELHRGLARQVLLAHEKQLVSLDAFVVAGSAVLSDLNDIPALAAADPPETELLPGEVPKGGKDGPVAILYANMTTKSFVEWYKALVDANLPFVVRHLGHVWYEEVGGTPTVLQGYGVRLDIRNVEYRVFDDRDEQPSETATMINVTSLSTLSSQFLAGVNVSALGLTADEALSLQAQLYKTHDAQQLHSQIIPPGWNRRQLSLQAAAAVSSSSSDMLMTLQDVSQNLPSVASTLVHLKVSDELTELAKNMEGLLTQTNGAALFVNGRRVPIDRPSFNVFEFLNVMKEEQAELEKLQTRLSPFLSGEALVQVQRAWSMGEGALADSDGDSIQKDDAVRIDVGRDYKGAVLYVNDIEKDPQYGDWPRQVQNMVFAQAMGGSPAVRRNMFTVLAVVDPLFDDDENPGILLATQLMQRQYPARLGVLIVNQGDLNACAEWVRKEKPEDDVPCPVSPVFAPDSTQDMQVMEELEASTHASFRILSHVVANYGMAAPSYLQYWTQSIAKHKEQRQDNLSLNDLIMIHGQLMSGMHIEDMGEAMNTAMEILKADEQAEDAPSYGKALRFAVSKGVKPGMSFINGRPIPSAESAGEIFMGEQNHIFRLVMNGEITDTGPKSVYAMLLTGGRVFDRVHPLLTDFQDGKNAYVSLTHGFDATSLFVPQKQRPTETPDAIFLVEAVLDLESSEGREFAANFIETMESIPGEEDEGGGNALAYRILPNTASSATSGLCTILAHASKFEVASLLEILKRDDISQMTVETIFDIMPRMSDGNVRAAIISDASACSNLAYLESDLPSTPFVVANGRVFSPEDAAMNKEDLELLLSIEQNKAKGITKLILPHLSFRGNAQYDAFAQTASFLAEQNSKDKVHRSDMEGMVLEMEETLGIESNPLRFSWNELSDGDLKVRIGAGFIKSCRASLVLADTIVLFINRSKCLLWLIQSQNPPNAWFRCCEQFATT